MVPEALKLTLVNTPLVDYWYLDIENSGANIGKEMEGNLPELKVGQI